MFRASMMHGLPIELHSFDIETQGRAYGCDVFVIQTLHNGCFPSVVQAPKHTTAYSTTLNVQHAAIPLL